MNSIALLFDPAGIYPYNMHSQREYYFLFYILDFRWVITRKYFPLIERIIYVELSRMFPTILHLSDSFIGYWVYINIKTYP